MLLRSRPDTVHGFPSRETQASTPLIKGSFTSKRPLRNITPAIADCRCKVPLPPRLHENYCSLFPQKSQGYYKRRVIIKGAEKLHRKVFLSFRYRPGGFLIVQEPFGLRLLQNPQCFPTHPVLCRSTYFQETWRTAR